MSDEDTTEATLERWRQRLETGDPVMTFYIDEPFEVAVSPKGELLLKFVWGQLGNFDRAAMAMAVLSPAAIGKMKAIFPSLEKILDTLPPALAAPAKN